MKNAKFARRYSRSVVLTAAALVVAASGVGFSQDAAQDGDKDQQQARRLPTYYARVVTEDQRQQIYDIQDKHAPQIAELQKQLDDAIAARDKEVQGVLSEEQLARVKEYADEAAAQRAARGGRRGRRGGNAGGGDGGTGGGGGGGQ